METIISVSNLTKVFGGKTVAVNEISFEIEKNTIFGLIGPNGSGKTTTQRMLTTILQPTSGTIKYKNHDLENGDINNIRRIIGYVPQGESLYGDLTIGENLDIFSRPFGLSNNKRQQRFDELLEKLKLKDRKNDLVKNLSGGLIKRVSIAVSLVHEPEVLFFDEITNGLDSTTRIHIWQLLKDLKKTSTIIFTTHYLDEAENLCDKIAIMFEGKILELDEPQTIIKKYKSKNLNEVMSQIISKEQ